MNCNDVAKAEGKSKSFTWIPNCLSCVLRIDIFCIQFLTFLKKKRKEIDMRENEKMDGKRRVKN